MASVQRGSVLAGTVLSGEEYAVEEVDIMSGHRAYGAHLLHRAQLVCANCGCIANFDLTKLQPIGEGS
jgi:hypothetical protein